MLFCCALRAPEAGNLRSAGQWRSMERKKKEGSNRGGTNKSSCDDIIDRHVWLCVCRGLCFFQLQYITIKWYTQRPLPSPGLPVLACPPAFSMLFNPHNCACVYGTMVGAGGGCSSEPGADEEPTLAASQGTRPRRGSSSCARTQSCCCRQTSDMRRGTPPPVCVSKSTATYCFIISMF